MSEEPIAVATAVTEPLDESAPLQWRFAEELCADTCRWYHGPRLYLRAVGVIAGVRQDGRFLLDAFTEVANERATTRALVCGAADYGTLAHLTAAFRSAGRRLDVTVVDKCATPLRMNEWYARRMGLPIETYQGNLFDFTPDHRFDLVCTHAFFGRFDRVGRRRVVEKWHALLGPGGTVVTAHRLRESLPDEDTPLAVSDRLRIRERVRWALERARALDDIDRLRIIRWADEFVDRKTTHPVASIDEQREAFRDAGFDRVSIVIRQSDRVDEGPPDRAPRVGIVAVRTR